MQLKLPMVFWQTRPKSHVGTKAPLTYRSLHSSISEDNEEKQSLS